MLRDARRVPGLKGEAGSAGTDPAQPEDDAAWTLERLHARHNRDRAHVGAHT
jgi:hypothetical protein